MGGVSTSWRDSSRYDWKRDRETTGKTARDYAKKDKRVYSGSGPKGIKSPKGLELVVKSDASAVFLLDVTGSMGSIPGMVLKKLGPAYHECNAAYNDIPLEKLEKMKPEDVPLVLEMSVIGVGDTNYDQYPLQVVPFSKGADLANGIKKILGEGGGGLYGCESYELVAYYLANHVKIPKGVKPLCVFVCDEKFYSEVKPSDVKEHIGDELGQSIASAEVFEKLKKKFNVYAIRPDNGDSYAQRQWENVLGKRQRVMVAPNADRIVDDFILISHTAAENYKQGIEILERRQIDPDKPSEGLKKMEEVLKTVHPDIAKEEMERLKKKYKK